MAENARTYNVAAIRRLLIWSFTPEDLKRFCQDRPVLADIVPHFGAKQGLVDMVEEVIDFCQGHYLWDELLAAVQAEYPRQYARVEHELFVPAAPAPLARPRTRSWDPRTWQPRTWRIGAPLGIAILALAAWWLLAGYPGPGGEPTAVPTPSGTPSPTPTTSPTPSPVPAPTQLPEPYRDVWQSLGKEVGPLGLPSATAVSRRYSVQEFEHGLMFYRNNKYDPPEDWIYVIYWGEENNQIAGNSWDRITETWIQGDPIFSCPEAAPLPLGPACGFGRVWCDYPEVRARLGVAIEGEANVRGGWLDFEHGVMLYDIWNKRVIVLLDDQHWRTYED